MKTWISAACSALALSACGGGGGPVEGDVTCVGEIAAPIPGEPVTVEYTVENPTDDAPFPDATVHVFPDGVITTDCEAPCEMLTADGQGRVEVTAPEGWFAYRVLGEPETGDKKADADRRMTTLEVGAVHPPDDEGFLNALFADSMQAIFSFAKGKADPDQGKAVVRGVDCDNVPLVNVRPRVFDLDGAELEVVTAYLNKGEGFPGIGRSGTNDDGRAFLANLPEGDVRIELWGHDGDGVDDRLACEVLPIEAGAATTARLRPLRADAHPACGGEDPLVAR